MSEFMKAVLVRAIRTMAQVAVATIGSAVVMSDVNWGVLFSSVALAGILSVLMSIATGLPEAEPAIEATDEDAEGIEAEDYNTDDYDDLFVDDDVDEGDDELEQEE